MKKNSFIERQKFTQLWLWLLLLGVLIIAIVAGNTAGVLCTLAGFILFYFIELRTEISKEGIRYRFFPFHFSEKNIKWVDIRKAYVRQYKPIAEYGGWGLRFGLKGTAFNTAGDMGLQLELQNGRKILIGTQRADELEAYLRSNIDFDLV